MTQKNQPGEPIPLEDGPHLIANDTAAYLELLLESQQRKEELRRIQALVATLEVNHQTAMAQCRLAVAQRNEKLTEITNTATRRLKQLISVSRAVCPILRLFLEAVGGVDGDGIVKRNPTCEKTASEMLALLQQYESM